MSVEAMGAHLILHDHLHGKVTFHVDHFSKYNLEELDKYSMGSDNEEKDTNVTSKVDQVSKANCYDETNKVVQANPDGQFDLSHLG